jgi:hypothetical protein
MVNGALGLLQAAITLTSMLAVLIGLNPWLAPAVLLAAIPEFVSDARFSKRGATPAFGAGSAPGSMRGTPQVHERLIVRPGSGPPPAAEPRRSRTAFAIRGEFHAVLHAGSDLPCCAPPAAVTDRVRLSRGFSAVDQGLMAPCGRADPQDRPLPCLLHVCSDAPVGPGSGRHHTAPALVACRTVRQVAARLGTE